MLLRTYRLQGPNGTELEALIHGNRLIKAAISTAEELRDLWASPAVKDMLRKRGIHAEVAPSFLENTAILNQQLHEDEGIPLLMELPNEDQQPRKRMKKQKLREKVEEDRKVILKINLKRIREQQAVDHVISKRRKTTTPSSS